EGDLLVQAEHIPVHLGSMPASVRAAIDIIGDPGPGGHVVVNDPFAGGTHLNDITIVTPCHVAGRLAGWAANRAHHAAAARGAAPGSMPADAIEIQQEGLRIPPVVLTRGVRATLLANSRTPIERAGDLDAQVGANVVGVARLAELIRAGAPVQEVIAYGDRRMRAALEAVPDGRWSRRDVMDSVGPAPSQQHPVQIVVTLTKAGGVLTFDFTGT